MQTAAIVAAVMLMPLGLFMWQRKASSRWTTIDASAPQERPAFYLVAFTLLVLLGLHFFFHERSTSMMRGTAAIAILLGSAAILNRWIKLSLHVAFAIFSAVILWRFAPLVAIAIFLFVPLLAWSHLALGRHSPQEVAGGAALGAIIGVCTLWI